MDDILIFRNLRYLKGLHDCKIQKLVLSTPKGAHLRTAQVRPKRVAAPRGYATRKIANGVGSKGRGAGESFPDWGRCFLVQISKSALWASCEVLGMGGIKQGSQPPIFNPVIVNFLNYFSEAHLCITKR